MSIDRDYLAYVKDARDAYACFASMAIPDLLDLRAAHSRDQAGGDDA